MTEKRSNSTQPQKDNFYQTTGWFYPTLFGIAFLGSILAFSAPLLFPLPQDDNHSVDTIRQLIFFLTGGFLALFTLIDAYLINRSLQNKHSSARTRQTRTERRVRYITAVEQITDANRSIRMGGIYTLIGLVDEWLTDDTLEVKEQQKEGQVIINNLCSYIRSPFTLALKAEIFEGDSEPDNYEGDFTKDQAAFHEEQDVRRTIFVEMSKRSSTFTKKKGEVIETGPGIWSDFDFDFSRAPIFYPLSNLTIEKGNFSSAKFYSNADFRGAAFTQKADFSSTNFTHGADFIDVKFIDNADFNNAEFHSKANFIGANFAHEANFNEATFTDDASFHYVIFTGEAKFGGATFTGKADFVEATFKGGIGFHNATFTNFEPTFSAMCSHAQFSVAVDRRNYNFSVTEESKPIRCRTAKLLNKPFDIPLNTILFDPDSDRISEPAK